MARRTHLTEIGTVAAFDLAGVGAGDHEGWLSFASLLAALHPHCLALAHTSRSLLLLLPSSPHSPLPSPLTITPHLSPDDGVITAVEFLAFSSLFAVAVGTSTGTLLVFSRTGDLIHKQVVYVGRVLRMRFREGGMGGSEAEELCLVMPGVIARFDGAHLKGLMERSGGWDSYSDMEVRDEDSFARIPFQLWSVSKYGPCSDAGIAGLMPPPLLEVQLLLLLGSRVSRTTVQLLLERMQWYQLIECQRIIAGH